jgi:hypothetical protein
LAAAGPYVEELNRLVLIEDVRVSDPESDAPARTLELGEAEEAGVAADDPVILPSIRIYPDGSSDSAEIVLCARTAEDDSRRLGVSLLGLTGTIRQHPCEDPSAAPDDESVPEDTEDAVAARAQGSSAAAPVPAAASATTRSAAPESKATGSERPAAGSATGGATNR